MVYKPARGNAGTWDSTAKVLEDGQLGVVRHPDGTQQVIVGDGSHVRSALPATGDPLAVKVTSQTLTSTQQAQALTNIRALSRDVLVDAVSEGVSNGGVTSAAAPLNTAQALLPTAGGRLLLRRGTYAMSTRMTVTKQGLILEGEGPGTVLSIASAAFQVGANDVLIKNMRIATDTVGTGRSLFNNVTTGAWKNWRFEHCVFDNIQSVVSAIGATTNLGGTVTSAAALTEHVEFVSCEFLNSQQDGVLDFRGSAFGLVDRCWFHDLGLSTSQGDNLKFEYGASNWRALHNTFERSARDAIDCYDGHRGLVEGNIIDTMGVFGIDIKVASNTAPNPADRIQVLGNKIMNTTADGISTCSPNVMICNNMLENGGAYGIRSVYKTNGTDRNQNITWMGNHVKGFTATSKPAFSALGIDGLVVIGNTATDGYQGFSVPLGSLISQNQFVIGGSTLNSSRGNSVADVWT